jgi:acetyl esterase/lipase
LKKRVQTIAHILSLCSLALSGLTRYQIRSPAGAALALFKALAAALIPWAGAIGAAGAVLGLLAHAPLAVLAGLAGAWASAKTVKQVTAPHDGFEIAFGPDWKRKIPPERQRAMRRRRWSWWVPRSPAPRWTRDVPYCTVPGAEGKPTTLYCDIWQPPARVRPSGVAIVYAHGSAWHVGDKDLMTRPFFRHLAAQGHVVMDIAYRLSPAAGILDMVSDVRHAVAWIKARAGGYGVDPERIVLGGGSAGGHLALLVAYTPTHPALTPPDLAGVDTSVRGVFAHYAAADMRAALAHARRVMTDRPVRCLNALVTMAEAMMGDAVKGINWRTFNAATMIGDPMGGMPEEVPDTYALASPITHVSPACPPTLLLHGEHDFIMPPHAVRELHRQLGEAGVPSIYVQFPQTDHGFDLFLPQTSPSAQAATYDLDRFLAWIAS